MFSYKFFNFLSSPIFGGSGPVNPVLYDKSLKILDHKMKNNNPFLCKERTERRRKTYKICNSDKAAISPESFPSTLRLPSDLQQATTLLIICTEGYWKKQKQITNNKHVNTLKRPGYCYM